ncbi:hypothetical protein [Streptomyces sp. NPDC003832]
MSTPTGDDTDRPLDPTLAVMANNICGILHGVIDPSLVASRLGAYGWRTRSSSWYAYEAETAWCRIEIDPAGADTTLLNGVIAPHRLNDLAALFTRLGWHHSLELSDEDDNIIEVRHH